MSKLRANLEEFCGKTLWRIKELASVSRKLSWKDDNHSCPLKLREAGGVRDPLGLTASF